MINEDINRFLGILLFPLLDTNLLFDNPLAESCPDRTDALALHRRTFEKNRSAIRKAAIQYIKSYYTVSSYDQIHQYLERWYLGEEVRQKMGHTEDGRNNAQWSEFDIVTMHLQALSTSMISKLDEQIVYKYWENEKDRGLLGGFAGRNKIFLFRSLTQTIPTDLLVILFSLKSELGKKSLDHFYGNIAVTDVPLESILKEGVAENHLHMGVSLPFSTFWESMMHPLKMGDLKKNRLPIEDIRTPDENIWRFYWCLARYLRMYIWSAIQYWSYYQKTEQNDNFFATLKLTARDLADESDIRRLKDSLLYDRTIDPITALESFFLEAQEPFVLPSREADAPSNECSFLFTAFTLLRSDREDERTPCFLTLQRLMMHYLRLKIFFFRTFVQNKTVMGLPYFQRHYRAVSAGNALSRASNGSNPSSKFETILRAQFTLRNLKKLELRTSFPNTETRGKKQIATFLRAYRTILHEDYCSKDENGLYRPLRPFPRVGLVFHFTKREQFPSNECIRIDDTSHKQFGALYKNYREQLEVFKALRNPELYPGIDKYLVGIDVASLETAVPTWVFRDLFNQARDGEHEPMHYRDGTSPFQSLSFTFHAGEDFRHLMSGVRRIDETIRHLKFHAGDRIGHGLALGICPEDWHVRNRNVILPRIEALENYVWAYRMLSLYPNRQSFANFQYLQLRIHALAKEICAKDAIEPTGLTVETLVDAYTLLFSQEDFACPSPQANLETCKASQCPLLYSHWTSQTFAQSYHCLLYIRKMQEPIHYQVTQQELEITTEVQRLVQEFVAQEGIVVEVNPSSNVTIGEIDTLHEHPMYTLSKIRYDYKNCLLCINSDDPGVFQTNAVNEMGFAYFGMIERGIGREACLEWLERLRKTGMQCSFIRRNDTDEWLLRELDDLLERWG